MLFVLLNWLYIFITAFISGFGVFYLVKKAFGWQVRHMHACLVGGLVILTTYAQWFSLLYRVNWEANALLVLTDAVIFLALRKPMLAFLKDCMKAVSQKKRWGIALLILVCAYFTSRGNYLYDTNLYHAQCIRWLEEYGIIKGLANLQSRAAYNSSFFCLSALYSMKYVFGQSMHAVQGFMALLLGLTCMDIGKLWKRKKPLLSDFARIGAIYYLTLLYGELISPSSDYAVMIILFYTVISWLDLLEKKETSTVPYSLICVLNVYTVTVKLTAGLIFILLIKPIYLLIKEKKGKEIACYLFMGSLVIAPYLIRNVMISGWLLYPWSGLDLFSVDWKVPGEVADADSFQICAWGRGIHEYGMYEAGPAKWLPGWFASMLSVTEKGLILADVAALIVLIGKIVEQFIRRKAGEWDKLLVMITMAASYLFWQFSAPLPRYGYAYILLLILLVFGDFYIRLCGNGKQVLLFALLGTFFLWKGMVLARGVWSARLVGHYVGQKLYDNNEGSEEVKERQVNGITFYYNVSGYHKLPGGGTMFEMRGSKIEDGFLFEYHNPNEFFGE